MFKFVILFAFAAVASGYYVIPRSYRVAASAHHPITYIKHAKIEHKPEKIVYEHKEEKHEPANYEFKYEVHDEHTGDIKQQHEHAVNGVVKGEYSLIDSDGYKRIVEYTADDHHGFQATVKREKTHFKIPEPKKYDHKYEPKYEHKQEHKYEHKKW